MENSKSEKYHQRFMENKDFSLAENIVFDMVRNLRGRRGIKQAWSDIDEEIQEEILETLIEIVQSNLDSE